MKPDFRALCAELLAELEAINELLEQEAQIDLTLLPRARAALAQPAPEPPTAALTEQTLADEVAELVEWLRIQAAKWKELDHRAGLEYSLLAERFTRTADLLAQPAPKPPTDKELTELSYSWFSRQNPHYYQNACVSYARAVLARWGQGNG